jgi:uncharacterized membrane protein
MNDYHYHPFYSPVPAYVTKRRCPTGRLRVKNLAWRMAHPIRSNVRTIGKLEEAALSSCSPVERLSDAITRFAGTISFLSFQVLLIGTWIGLNLGMPDPFDPFPFHFLSLVVGVEALVLAIFVLMNQNRMSHIADQRAHIDLQVNLLTEQDVTHTLRVLKRIASRLGVDMKREAEDAEDIDKFMEKTDVKQLVEELDRNTSQ